MNREDWEKNFTAFILGQLSKTEEAEISAFLNESVEARLFYQDLRQAIMNRAKSHPSDKTKPSKD